MVLIILSNTLNSDMAKHTMIMEQDSTALKIQIWQKNGVLALITTVMPTNIKLHVMVFQFLI